LAGNHRAVLVLLAKVLARLESVLHLKCAEPLVGNAMIGNAMIGNAVIGNAVVGNAAFVTVRVGAVASKYIRGSGETGSEWSRWDLAAFVCKQLVS
jgi:hypothetical protein